MKIEELKYHQDSMMEINSCIKCLGDFYTFASDRLRYYQEINKHKGNVDLLNLMEPGDESSDEIREVYIERQYWVTATIYRNTWRMLVMNLMIYLLN